MDGAVEFARGVEAGGGGAVAVDDAGGGDEDGGPVALPGAVAEVEVFDVGGDVLFAECAEGVEFGGVHQGAAAAAVQDVGVVFTGERGVAAEEEVVGLAVGAPNGFAGFLAADAFGEEDLSGGAEEMGDAVEGIEQGREEAGLEGHVIVEEEEVGVAGEADAAVDGDGEGERGVAVFDGDGGMGGGEPVAGAVGGAVVDDDELVGEGGELREESFEEAGEEVAAIAGRDDDGDAFGE